MNEVFRHKPRNTDWIGCEVFVSYDCDSTPKVDELVVTGVKQLGFVLSHEYDVRAKVTTYTRELCNLEDCTNGVRYHFTVRFSVFDRVGLGFGAGGGTGTFGITLKPDHSTVSWLTDCICCPLASPPTSTSTAIGQHALGSAIALVLALLTLGVGVSQLTAQEGSPISRASLLLITGLIAACGLLALVRTWRHRSVSHDGELPPRLGVGTATASKE